MIRLFKGDDKKCVRNQQHNRGIMKYSDLLKWGCGAAALLAVSLGSVQAEIRGQGSDSTIAIVKALAEEFQKTSGIVVNVEGGGSSAGAKALIAGDVDFAFLSRKLKTKESDAGLQGIEYAIDGVAVIVNKNNPVENLTIDEIKEFYTGVDTDWSDGKRVFLFTRNANSGTREVFEKIVLGKDKISAAAKILHDGLIINKISKIPSSIAYTSLSEVDSTKVKAIKVNEVQPSVETLQNDTYPISRRPTLASQGVPSGEVKAFFDFIMSDAGQAVVAREGLVRIR